MFGWMQITADTLEKQNLGACHRDLLGSQVGKKTRLGTHLLVSSNDSSYPLFNARHWIPKGLIPIGQNHLDSFKFEPPSAMKEIESAPFKVYPSESNIFAPEKGWLEYDCFLLGRLLLVSRSVPFGL